MKPHILIFSFLLFSLYPAKFIAQDISSSQIQLIHNKISEDIQKPEGFGQFNNHGLGNLLLTFYQKFISVQISADCIYLPSCSRFSRMCINKYGLITGILATGDRLTRCSPFSAKDIPEYKFNEDETVDEIPQ